MKSVFEFQHYRNFLQVALPVKGSKRGGRNRLAFALNCQKGFVSQVLGGSGDFSLEHGIKISRFLGLDSQEEEYFLLLLHKDRAGSRALEQFYAKKILEIQERRKQIKTRIRSHTDLNEVEQATYYSAWYFTAVHMCLMVPELRTRAAITTYLGIGTEVVNRVLDFLFEVGLATQAGEKLGAGPSRIHLPNHSPHVNKHHTNWRLRALHSLDTAQENDIHYSLVMSISESAAEEIREILLQAIQNVEPVMKAAKDETIYSLNMDFFNLQERPL